MLFTSTMPTHAEKKQGEARIIFFKTSQYRRFWRLACMMYDV
jgi:hypothetical protein